jgi:hyperosmotically inducible periplasmic protein
MTNIRCTATLAGFLSLVAGLAPALAADKAGDSTETTKKHSSHSADAPTPPAADNTGTNRRDRKETEPTADQQKNGKTDLQLTTDIRRAVIADKDLSTNAHNIKIIAQDGKVTLKGPVDNAAEKKSVEGKAAEVAGRDNVVSEIQIKH